jgi:hypothetical protein
LGKFLSEKLDLFLQLLDPPRIVERLRFGEFFLQVTQLLAIGGSGLRIEHLTSIGESGLTTFGMRSFHGDTRYKYSFFRRQREHVQLFVRMH